MVHWTMVQLFGPPLAGTISTSVLNNSVSGLLEALAQAGIPVPADVGSGEATAVLCRAVHAFLASSSAQLFLAKLDDLLGEREQLNMPGTTFEAPNWRRKLSAGVDDPMLLEALDELRRICAAYGRNAG